MQDAARSPQTSARYAANAGGGSPVSAVVFSHNPSTPQFFVPPKQHAKRPDVLFFAQRNLERFYAHPSGWLRSLREARLTPRQARSEARERDAAVLGVLLHYTELATLRVGIPNDDGVFNPITMKFIATRLGWRSPMDDVIDKQRIAAGLLPLNRGVKRVYRAIANLKRAGYLTVHPRFEKMLDGDQGYIGLAAVRRLSPKLFRELGITALRLKLRRDQASKRLRARHAAYGQKAYDDKLRHLMAAKSPQANPSKASRRRGLCDSKTLLAAQLGELTPVSGNTHNTDFASVYPALAKLLPDKPT